jgi:hypothetical protein
VKLSYILKVTYPIAAVMAKIHSPAVAMRAPRSMVFAVCDTLFLADAAGTFYQNPYLQLLTTTGGVGFSANGK